ncbi:MAG: IPT/TIG domain-containing protein [Mariniphaga sp.]
MKNIYILGMALLLTAIFVSCEDNFMISGSGIVKAPILRDIVFPDPNNSNPGTDVVVQGKGFSVGDKIYLKNSAGSIEVTVKAVAEGSFTFAMPEDAGGEYSIEVERASLKTLLPGTFSVPYLLVLRNIVMPVGNYTRGEVVTIEAEGFANGDSVYLLSSTYPTSTVIRSKGTVSGKNLSFSIPSDAYGLNTAIGVRWDNGNVRKGTIGTIGVKANVGDEIGGGVVFYMMDEIHGLICNKTNITASAVNYGPACNPPAGTSADIGKGNENSVKLLKQIVAWRGTGSGEWLTKKTVVELCDEYSVTVNGLTYDDWFLPSINELSQLFKARQTVAVKGATFRSDNYWSSTEVVGGSWAWAQLFVNFYEAVNLVTGAADRSGWFIGVIPIRTF